jgi:hypothetical protein
MKVRGRICRAAALGCVHTTFLLGKGEAIHARTMSIPTPKITLVFGRPQNDIYKIALNYSQIAQIYSDA